MDFSLANIVDSFSTKKQQGPANADPKAADYNAQNIVQVEDTVRQLVDYPAVVGGKNQSVSSAVFTIDPDALALAVITASSEGVNRVSYSPISIEFDSNGDSNITVDNGTAPEVLREVLVHTNRSVSAGWVFIVSHKDLNQGRGTFNVRTVDSNTFNPASATSNYTFQVDPNSNMKTHILAPSSLIDVTSTPAAPTWASLNQGIISMGSAGISNNNDKSLPVLDEWNRTIVSGINVSVTAYPVPAEKNLLLQLNALIAADRLSELSEVILSQY